MKEILSKEFVDLRIFDNPIDSIDIIQSITSEKNIENESFYVVDLEDICNKHVNWITKLPRVEPHYAVKCNTDEMMLRLLAFLGAGFDCASKNEIQKVLDLGVSPDRIIFANPCKQASNIKYANKVGVSCMTFDNEHELYKIKEHHPNAKIVLRIITNDENAVCRFSMKFGADMESAPKLIELAIKLDLDLVGISFHVGSGQMSPESFSESIGNARKLFDYAREDFGCKMQLLDLGGGYPGSSDSGDLFSAISTEINSALDQHFPVDFFAQINGVGDNKLRIIAEPGRYYASSAFTLCVSIIAKRVMRQSDEQQLADKKTNAETTIIVNETNNQLIYDSSAVDYSKSIMYYINDGVYASFNCLFYDHADCIPILMRDEASNSSCLHKSSIWGPTCDGLDVVVKESFLPEMDIGEFMVFKNMGAYTISGAVAFNGIPLPQMVYVASTSWETIKNAFKNVDGLTAAPPSMQKEVVVSSSTCASVFSRNRAVSFMQQQQKTVGEMIGKLEDGVGSVSSSSSTSDLTLSEKLDKDVTSAVAPIDYGITC